MLEIIAENYFEIGNLLREKGKLREAIIAYGAAVRNSPKNYLYYLNLAIVLQEVGDIKQALKNYQKTISLNHTLDYLYEKIGSIYYILGLWVEAEKYYQKLLTSYTGEKRERVYLQLGDISLKQNKPKQAVINYQQAQEFNPTSLEVKIKLGLAYGKLQEWENAINYYHQALKAKPELYDGYLGLGMVFAAQGIIQEAISCYTKALKIKPNDARAYQKLQSLLAQSATFQDAELESLYQSLELQPNDPSLYYKLGEYLSNKGLVEEAIECYLKAIQIKPTFSQVYYSLIHATLYIDDLEKVVDAYLQVIDNYPKFIPAYVNLATTLTRQGKIQEALAYQKKAVYNKTIKQYPELVNFTTSCCQPDFIIIGAEKCGTTSLYSYITQHPQVLGPIAKEIHFFSHHFNYGLDWYLSHFPKLPLGYLTGEASTSYIGCHNNAHRRLFNLFPKVKLLAILRDPIDRSISHYHQLVKLGREGRKIEDVINQEIEILTNIDNIWDVRQAYWRIGNGTIWHSLYVYFLQEWLNFFPKEQFLILSSEKLFANPEETMKTVWNFLHLSPHQLDRYSQYNLGISSEQIDKLLRQKMATFFAPHNLKLRHLLINYQGAI
jgi:tetratricopeptide (TPR) repeat protein